MMREKVRVCAEPKGIGPLSKSAVGGLVIGRHLKRSLFRLLFIMPFILWTPSAVMAQSPGGHTLFGDFKVEEDEAGKVKPISFSITLYDLGGRVVARQTVTSNGRYRFVDVPDGEYNIVVEVENSEVARIRATLFSPVRTDFRQDIHLEWRSDSVVKKREKVGVITASGNYQRAAANSTLFNKAGEAIKKKDYDQAASLLHQILNIDPKDFEAWTELGTVLLIQKNNDEAEKAYLRALEIHPTFILALVNLGQLRLMQKKFEGAVETLSQAVKLQPQSATANYYLGEAYLQIKKGSKAVIYLNEALRLDPQGKAEAHLRLAALYNAAGMKARAAAEYEQFLVKRPDYPNKKKLQQYISENQER